MKKLSRLILLAMGFIMIFSFSACGGDGGDDTTVKGPGFTIERDKYFYGAGEMMTSSNNDYNQTPEMCAKLAGALGVQTFRLWMHTGGGFAVRQPDNTIKLSESGVNTYKRSLQLLADEGITNIIGMTHYYPYPAGMTIAPGQYGELGAFPRPDSAHYNTFMQLIEETFFQMAKTFPEVKYWEVGNEVNDAPNHHMYCRPADGGTPFTMQEKARVTTDLMFYATKGMKRGNPECVSVMPGLVFDNSLSTGIVPFVAELYKNIKSGTFPSTGMDDTSVNSDDYFDVLNWHPYNFDGNNGAGSAFQLLNERIYDVAIENGDEGKKVILTEFGYTTTENANKQHDRPWYENRQKSMLANAFKNIYDYLPYVESVIIFRMFDAERAASVMGVESTIETGFGLFTSAGLDDTWKGPRPKAMTVELFKLIKGADADTAPLYQYYDQTKPNGQ